MFAIAWPAISLSFCKPSLLFSLQIVTCKKKKISRRMASLHCAVCPSPSVIGFRRPNRKPSTTVLAIGANLFPTPLNLRFKNAARLQVRQSSFALFASNTNPPDQDSLRGKSDGTATSNGRQGPPFLTILAGVVVFLLVFWIIGSIVSWLLSLVFNLPSSK